MIPNTPAAIGFIAQRLMTAVIPEMRTSYGVADLALIGTLLALVGQDYERAAQARLDDIREMRDIFSDAEQILHDDALSARAATARLNPLHDLHISALDVAHAEHARVLIDVHAHVETLHGAAAQQVNLRIWEHLEKHAERHRYDVAF